MRPAAAALLALVLSAFPAKAQEQVWEATYPEGPIWIDDQLYWTEMQTDSVMRLGADGPEIHAQLDGCGPTSVAPFDGDGLAVLCHFDGSVLAVDRNGRPSVRFATAGDGKELRNPNDSFADAAGAVWFTDPGRFSVRVEAEGRLYRLAPDGVLMLHDSGLRYGNGVYVDAQAGRLLVSEHLARRVLAYPMTGLGLGAPDVLIDLDALGLPAPTYPKAGPDGLEMAPDGTLWIAEYGSSRLIAWRDDAGLVGAVPVPAQFVTNIAFGPDGRAAVVGSFENNRARNRGAIWLTTQQALTAALHK